MYGEMDFLGEIIQPKAELTWACSFICIFFPVTEKEPPDLTNFTANTKDIASSESEKECSVLTNFTMKTEDRATFEWENGKEATANLVKEKDECIYR